FPVAPSISLIEAPHTPCGCAGMGLTISCAGAIAAEGGEEIERIHQSVTSPAPGSARFLCFRSDAFQFQEDCRYAASKNRRSYIGRERMIRIALVASLAMLAPFGASAQTTDQLVKGATDTSNVLNYGMGYNLQRFSPLTQINKDNDKNLVPVWNYSFSDDRSEESQPIIYQGVLYVTTHAATMAVDAKTGK